MVGTTRSLPHVHALRSLAQALAGRVILADDPAYDEARLSWNRATDQRPVAVVLAESTGDVEATIAAAREAGLQVAAQGRGHGGGAFGRLDDTILLNTSRLAGVTVDPGRRQARVEAGVNWGGVGAVAAPHGLVGLHGSSPDVGVVGFSLGGGIGWLARRYGLAANSILGAEVVTADGRRLSVDAEHEPDLFWALRGGGGSFAIVTALEVELYPVDEIYAGILFWPQARATEILQAWSAWTATVPDDVTSIGRLLNFPPIPLIPEHLRGGSFVAVEAAILGSATRAAELIQPLVALGPAMNTFATMPVSGLEHLHMDPIDPVPVIVEGRLLRSFPSATVDALVKVAGPGTDSPLLSVEIRHAGGALAKRGPGHGALGALDGEYVALCISLAMTPEMHAVTLERATAVLAALAPWAGRLYMNFWEHAVDPKELFDAETVARLKRVKATYDPGDVIRSNHPIPAR